MSAENPAREEMFLLITKTQLSYKAISGSTEVGQQPEIKLF